MEQQSTKICMLATYYRLPWRNLFLDRFLFQTDEQFPDAEETKSSIFLWKFFNPRKFKLLPCTLLIRVYSRASFDKLPNAVCQEVAKTAHMAWLKRIPQTVKHIYMASGSEQNGKIFATTMSKKKKTLRRLSPALFRFRGDEWRQVMKLRVAEPGENTITRYLLDLHGCLDERGPRPVMRQILCGPWWG